MILSDIAFGSLLFIVLFNVVAKAFAIATALVLGGSALTFGLAASKLELHNVSIIFLSLLIYLMDV